MLDLATVVIVALAVYRLARIIPSDVIAEPIRARLYRWSWADTERVAVPGDDDQLAVIEVQHRNERGEPEPRPRGVVRPYVNALLTCPVCSGFWLAPVVYGAWRWGHDVGRGVVTVLAVAGAGAVLAEVCGRGDA